MTVERIDIQIRDDGARVVRRDIESIGDAGVKAQKQVDFLKRALTGLAAFGVAKGIIQMADTFTRLENRLRSTGLEGQNLTKVYQDLRRVSNDTRSSLEGSVELYSRLALSSKELGVNQNQLIDFTKSLNQAIILSGASMQEAQNGLIQLSQGMASGTLRGDELRSVLEQLPAVADVIAKGLGVTRGQLRKMGEEGKITAKEILNAFADARMELNDRFGKSVTTIGQAWQVFKNNLLNAVGQLDKSLGFTRGLSENLFALANSVDDLVMALFNLGKVLIVVGTAYATWQASLKVNAIAAAVSQWLDFRKAVASGNVVLLGSAEASRQRALATAQAAAGDLQGAAAATAAARAEQANALAKVQSIRHTVGLMQAERALEIVRLQAQISQIGRTQSLTRLGVIRREEAGLVKILAREEAALAAAQAASASAQGAQAAQAARVAQSYGAYSTAAAGAAGTTTLFGQAIGFLKTQILRLYAVVAANPFTFLFTALAAGITLLVTFRKQIKLGTDELTTLGDFMRAVGESVVSVFRSIAAWASKTFGPIVDQIKAWFSEIDVSVVGVIRMIARGMDSLVGIVRGAVYAVLELFRSIGPAVSDIFTTALNAVLRKIGAFVNKAGELLNTVTEFAGLEKIATNVDFTLSNENAGAAADFGKNIGSAFMDGFKTSTKFEDYVNDRVNRAQDIAADRFLQPIQVTAQKVGQPVASPVDEKAIEKLKKDLQGLLSTIDPLGSANKEFIESQQLLNKAFAAGVISEKELVQYTGQLANHYRDILDPLGAMNREMETEARLLKMSARERDIEAELLQRTNQLKADGRKLTENETAALREQIAVQQNLARMTQVRDSLLEQSVGARTEAIDQMRAMSELMKDPTSGFTQGDAVNSLNSAGPLAGMFDGTQALIDAQMEQFQFMYSYIDGLRQADVISEQTAAQLKTNIALQEAQVRLQNTQNFFDNLSSLSGANSKKLQKIGKAAALVSAQIDGYAAIQKALAAPPGWPYNAASVIGVGIQTAANIGKIAGIGFEAGGWTGSGPRKAMAGAVHGQEFVMNARATRRLGRSNLESLQRGTAQVANSSGGGARLSVSIENYGSDKEFEVTQLDESRVQVIARDVARQQIQERTPKLVAAELQNPNSKTSKQMNRSYSTPRKR